MSNRDQRNTKPWWFWLIVFLVGLAFIGFAATQLVQGEEGEHFSFLPAIFTSGEASEPTPTPDTCSDPDADVEPHEPDGSNWFPPVEGEERVVNIWFPGHPVYNSLHKLRLYPGDNVGLVNGGGDSASWPVGCAEVANQNFMANPNDPVELIDLINAGLVYDPTASTPTPEPSNTPPATATQPPDPTGTPIPTNTPDPTATNTPVPPTPTPDLCAEPVAIENFDPTSWPYPGYGYWQISDEFEVSAQLWSNLPNRTQQLRKLRVHANGPDLFYLGGGYIQYWHSSCVDEAQASYDNWDLPEVTMTQLVDEGFLVDPSSCQSPAINTRTPEVGVPWELGGDSSITVGQLWTNEEGQSQEEFKSLLHPLETQWPVLAGGTTWSFNLGCGEEAQAQLDILDVPVCDIQCLDSRGLLAWPE